MLYATSVAGSHSWLPRGSKPGGNRVEDARRRERKPAAVMQDQAPPLVQHRRPSDARFALLSHRQRRQTMAADRETPTDSGDAQNPASPESRGREGRQGWSNSGYATSRCGAVLQPVWPHCITLTKWITTHGTSRAEPGPTDTGTMVLAQIAECINMLVLGHRGEEVLDTDTPSRTRSPSSGSQAGRTS
jgi:hypothetical protein